MLPEYKKKTNLGVGFFIVATAFALVVEKSAPAVYPWLALLGWAGLMYGCAMYAKGKGYSPHLGWLGIFWLLGLIVLAVLPDKEKQAEKRTPTIP